MEDADYNELLDWLEETTGGIGSVTKDNIRGEFPEGDNFVEACRDAYEDRELEPSTQIEGIGRGYARGKLALRVARYYDWNGGDLEPQVVRTQGVVSFADQR